MRSREELLSRSLSSTCFITSTTLLPQQVRQHNKNILFRESCGRQYHVRQRYVQHPIAVVRRVRPSALPTLLPLFPRRDQLVREKRTVTQLIDSVALSVLVATIAWVLSLPFVVPLLALAWPFLAPFGQITLRNARFRLSLRDGIGRVVVGVVWYDAATRMAWLDDGDVLLRTSVRTAQVDVFSSSVNDGQRGCALVVGTHVLAVVALDSAAVFVTSPFVCTDSLREAGLQIA